MATDLTARRQPAPDTGGGRSQQRAQAQQVRAVLARYGVLAAMVITFAVFSLLRPDSFFTALTMKGILRDCAPLLIVALGVTVVLVMNEYDLAVGGLISLCATIVVVLLSTQYEGMNYWVAIILTLGIGTALGAGQGVLIAYLRLPSFILTIAMSTVFTGLGLQLVDSQSVFEGIAPGYAEIANGTFLGFSNVVFIGLAVLLIAHVLLRHTEPGRYMYAIGGNREAARLSGLRVRLLLAVGFAIVGLTAAIAGVLMTSQAAAANPNTGVGLLLPAYAAAFLGSSMFRVGVFTPLGTALGALYLQIIGTGLTILSLSGPLVQIIQGGILAAAVLISRLVRGGSEQ
ncbi:ABC transporter permease [Conexibacter stalactiti]|uniref:ABC transporter permease n=1 Tax=Conexibacter stalactiti TaxID=1940611 RepID=A0ABU4HU15_9ACTN|nr:ABC transporter permease [Conexibacter stalactiti]MDW5596294.1 ABC transporter permease [Conexibacter stalactiti]MEC5036936.1 ABC transporter permease [Conexibacter stalactiti]